MVARKESDLQYPNMKADLELCYKQLFAICKGERGPLAVMSIPPRTDNFDMQFSAAFDELKAYRETGLEPEDVNLMIQCVHEDHEPFSTAAHIYELLQAEREGRLVVLPCVPSLKPGHAESALYLIEDGEVIEDFLTEVVVGKNAEDKVNAVYYTYDGYAYMESDIGKMVFASKEEAEKVLRPKTIPANDLYDEDGQDVKNGSGSNG